MSEQQLTVAELMARAAKEGGRTSSEPRRRRRRSLEEGGVSVAELTGSIPRVKAKPAEAKHTSEPLDEPAETVASPAETAAAPAQEPKAEQPVATQPAAEKADQADQAEVEEPKAEPEQAAKLRQVEKPAAEKAEPKPAAPVVSPAQEDAQRSVTDSFPAQQPTEVAESEEKPAEKPESVQDVKDTAIIPAVVAPETESVDQPVQLGEPVDTDTAAALPVEQHDADFDEYDEDEDDDISVLSVVGMALLGVIVGIGLFIGFKILWSSVSPILVAVLALAMTAGLVGVVHALRTERDRISMILATIAGLAITFGPMLIAKL